MLFKLFIVSFLFLSLSYSIQPGLKATVTNKGLDYARQVGVTELNKLIPSITIPDLHGKTGTPIGDIDYDITKIILHSLTFPSSSIKTLPGKGVELVISGVSASVSCDWHYRESAWPHISDSGSADISLSQVSLIVDIGFGSTNGAPTCNVISCIVSIAGFDIKIHGGASWLYNIFLSLFKSTIKDAISNGLRGAIISAINANLNQVLQTLPVKINILNLLLADYSLVDNPRFADYLVVDCKGEFYDIKNPQEAPFTPGSIPDVQNTNVMVQFTLDQYVADTGCFALWKSGALNFNINDSMIPHDFPFRFNTNSFQFIIPALYNKYPGKDLQAILDPIASPIITFISNGTIEIFGQFELSMFVVQPPLTHVFTLGLNVTTEGGIKMNGTMLAVNLTYGDIQLSLLETDIGPFDVQVLESIAMLTLSEVIPMANYYFNSGIPLPTIPGVTFINPYLGYGNGFIYVNTDVKYTPKFYSQNEIGGNKIFKYQKKLNSIKKVE